MYLSSIYLSIYLSIYHLSLTYVQSSFIPPTPSSTSSTTLILVDSILKTEFPEKTLLTPNLEVYTLTTLEVFALPLLALVYLLPCVFVGLSIFFIKLFAPLKIGAVLYLSL